MVAELFEMLEYLLFKSSNYLKHSTNHMSIVILAPMSCKPMDHDLFQNLALVFWFCLSKASQIHATCWQYVPLSWSHLAIPLWGKVEMLYRVSMHNQANFLIFREMEMEVR